MPAQTLLGLIQAKQFSRNGRLRRSPVIDDSVMKQCNVVLAQSYKLRSRTSVNWKILAKLLQHLCQPLVRSIEISQEPKATWRCDRKGRLYLHIYDPSTEKHYYVDSTEDTLNWLGRSR